MIPPFFDPLLMRVSAILPVYNGERYLEEALQSIFAQTRPPDEIIVVDDGSTDGSASIVKKYPEILYVHQKNQGNALARMKGVELASGDWIAFLDQDDRWVPPKLALQIAACKKDPNCQCLVGKVHYFADVESSPPKGLKQVLFQKDGISFVPGVLMAQRELLQKIPFNPLYRYGSDTEWFFRLNEAKIPLTVLPEVLLEARMHAGNLSHEVASRYKELLQITRASIARKTFSR